ALRCAARRASLIDVVESSPFVEERRIGRIQVFWFALTENPPTKCNHSAAGIADLEHQPSAESVVCLSATLRLDQHAGFDEAVFTKLSQCAFESRSALGRKSQAELLHHGCVDPTAFE